MDVDYDLISTNGPFVALLLEVSMTMTMTMATMVIMHVDALDSDDASPSCCCTVSRSIRIMSMAPFLMFTIVIFLDKSENF